MLGRPDKFDNLMQETNRQNKQLIMPEITNRRNKPSFFLIMGWIGLFAVVVGFATTFIMPVSAGTFKAPFVIYLHGTFAFSWIILYLTQTNLIHFKSYRIHMTLGYFGVFLALGVSITMLPAGVFQVKRDLNEGLGDTAISSILGICTAAIIFLALVFAAIVNRKKPERHKRFMLLAIIVVLFPAWFRFRHYFPSVPRPDIWFACVLADSFIVFAWIWDKMKNGKVHPILSYIGLLIIVENIIEILLFDSNSWRSISKVLYGFLSSVFNDYV